MRYIEILTTDKAYRKINDEQFEFEVGGVEYVFLLRENYPLNEKQFVLLGLDPYRLYQFYFKPKNTTDYSITGAGNQFTVFNTVATIFKNEVYRNPIVQSFYFTAEEPSRIKAYNIFAKEILRRTNFELVRGDQEELLDILGEDHAKLYFFRR